MKKIDKKQLLKHIERYASDDISLDQLEEYIDTFGDSKFEKGLKSGWKIGWEIYANDT